MNLTQGQEILPSGKVIWATDLKAMQGYLGKTQSSLFLRHWSHINLYEYRGLSWSGMTPSFLPCYVFPTKLSLQVLSGCGLGADNMHNWSWISQGCLHLLANMDTVKVLRPTEVEMQRSLFCCCKIKLNTDWFSHFLFPSLVWFGLFFPPTNLAVFLWTAKSNS